MSFPHFSRPARPPRRRPDPRSRRGTAPVVCTGRLINLEGSLASVKLCELEFSEFSDFSPFCSHQGPHYTVNNTAREAKRRPELMLSPPLLINA